METAKHIIIVLALILFATGAATSAEKPVSGTQRASCIIQVTLDTGILPFKSEEINSLIHSSGIMGKAAREVLEAMPEDIEVSASFKNPTNTGKTFTYPIELSVKLKEGIEPAAEEFLKAIVEKLRETLTNAFDKNQVEFRTQYETALRQYNEAESQLKKLSDEAASVGVTYSDASRENSQAQSDSNKQLEKIVKLPNLSPTMTLEEVLQVIAHSAEPPLQIQPKWKDLADNADILPTTPPEMNPFENIKLGKALDVLMECISNELAKVDYTTDNGVITIATKESLKPKVYFVVYEISGLLINGRTSSSIIRAIKETIEPDSWNEEGNGKIVDIQGGKILISNTPQVQDKIQKFLKSLPIGEIPSESLESVPLNVLNEDKLNLSRQKRTLEMEIARLEARQDTIVKRIPIISDQAVSNIKNDPIIKELQQLLNNENQRMEQIKLQFEQKVTAHSAVVDEEDKLSRLRIELAKRREELGIAAGGEQLSMFKDNASLNQLKQNLDVLLAELEVLKKAMTDQNPEVKKKQDQIAKIKEQIASHKEEDTITSELMRLIENQTQQLAIMKQEVEIGRRTSSELAVAEEKLIQAKIQLAKRREELGKAVGGEQLSMFNNELSDVMLNLAEKKAGFQVLEKQIGEIESQIQAASTTDPKILKVRQARKAFQEAEKRLNELKAIEINLQPPQVIAIGLE